MMNMMRGGSSHNGMSQFNGSSTYNGAPGFSSWLSSGLCMQQIPEVYNGWNDPQVPL